MFVGRSRELEKLNEMYFSDSFEHAVVYGRRRVGKTALIKEFIKDKNAVYFLAREADATVNLTMFYTDVYVSTKSELKDDSLFPSWEDALKYVYDISGNERLVLIIDDYQFLDKSHKSISSIFKSCINNQFVYSKLFLIFCVNNLSFSNNDSSSSNYTFLKQAALLEITPLSFFESLPFFSTFKGEDKAVLYGVTGGMPCYLNKINRNISVDENIAELFLKTTGFLYEEPTNLLKDELRELAVYNGVMHAIANGAFRLNDISIYCGCESNKCAKYLKSLILLGFAKKEIPVTEAQSKKSKYLIADFMFRFWYRFIFSNKSKIELGNEKEVYDEISRDISSYMELVFEEICKQYLVEESRKNTLPFRLKNIGSWWATDQKEKYEKIDILAFSKNSSIFGQCCWDDDLVDIDILTELKEKSEMFSYKNKWFWIFAKRGFTDGLIKNAKDFGNVRLVTFPTDK